MSLLPTVRANLEERFIFNFRMAPERLQKYLPAPWLAPQEINGFGVASYCLLDLRNITVAPLPTAVGLTSISCAPRYAVVDTSGTQPRPAVFVTERQTNSAFGAWFTSLGFSAPHPHIEAAIGRSGEDISLRARDAQREVFCARVRPAGETRSALFASPQAFAAFIAEGISSYGLSIHGDRLTKMDLHKDDATYEPLETSDMSGPLIEEWQSDGAVFDSAFRTSGGRYEWAYHGLTD